MRNPGSSVWFGLMAVIFAVSAAGQQPAIVTPPLSQLVVKGGALSAAALATGAPPLTYVWRRNGETVPGASTASLAIASAALADRGWYQLEVSNGLGTARSVFRVEVVEDKGAVVAWGDNYSNQSQIPPGIGNAVAVAAGRGTYVLRADGTVVTWPSYSEVLETVATSATAISVGTHLLAVRTDGTLAGAGDNYYGQSSVPGTLSRVVAAAAGSGFSVALRADGTVVGWGDGDQGQTAPPPDPGFIVDLAAGGSHVLALRADGTVVAWGSNSAGQCAVPAGLNNVVALSAGSAHSLALRRDGTVVAWGLSSGGRTTIPAEVTGVVRISAGVAHNLALKADGTVVAWGETGGGYLNLNTVPSVLGIAQARGVSAGYYHNVVLIPAVLPQIVAQPPPQAVAAGSSTQISVAATGTRPLTYVWKKDGAPLTTTPDGRISGVTTANLVLTTIAASDAGSYTVEITNGAGTVVSTGAVLTIAPPPVFTTRPASRRAQVGQPVTLAAAATGTGAVTYQWRRHGQPLPGATAASYTINPVTHAHRGPYEVVATDAAGGQARAVVYLHPATSLPARAVVRSWGNWSTSLIYPPSTLLRDPVTVSSGQRLNLALERDGTVAEWGEDYYNQNDVPAGLASVVAVSAGAGHALALKSDGTIAAWGSGMSGQTWVPAGLRDVVAVAAGDSYSAVLRSNQTVVIWGSYFVLPVPDAASVGNVIAIEAGEGGVLALRADGTVAGLRNAVQPPAGLNSVTAIAAGASHYLALKADGTVVGWGTGSAATVPPGLTGVVEIAAGANHSLALKQDGSVVSWGANSYGQSTVPSGVANATEISAGTYHSVVLVPATAPAILAAPRSETVFAGSTAVFSVAVLGVEPIAYRWLKGSDELNDGAGISGSGSSVLVLTNVQAAAAGSYAVRVSDASGTVTTAAVTLSVLPITNGTPPNDAFASAQTLGAGAGTATGQNLGATGETGEPSHSPSYAGSAATSVWFTWTAPASGYFLVDTSGSDFTTALAAYKGTAVNALTLIDRSQASAGFPGSYAGLRLRVRAGDVYRFAVASGTSDRGSFKLNYQFFAAPANDDLANAQVISGANGSVTGNNTYATAEPGEATHSPDGSGLANGSLWYRWTAPQTGVVVLENSSSEFYRLLAAYTGSSVTNLTSVARTVTSAGSAARLSFPVTAGTTYLIAVDSYYDNRGAFTQTWNLQTAPAIQVQPVNQVSTVGGAASFSVSATGGVLGYQWLRDGLLLAGATNATLSLSNLTVADAGTYQVRVTNLVGSTLSSQAILSGSNPAPTLATPPQSTAVVVGQAATLRVVATGVGTLAYQWRRNGVALPAATTDTLVINAAARHDADTYDVLVSDGMSVTRSPVARVGVEPPTYPGLVARVAGADLVPETSEADFASLVVPAPDGKYYVAGRFKALGGLWRHNVARLNADLTLDLGFVPPVIDGWIRALASRADGTVWIAGELYSVDGVNRGSVIRLRTDGSLDRSIAMELKGDARAMALLSDGGVLVGGSISKIDTYVYHSLFKLDALGAATSVSTPPTVASIYAMAPQSDGKILVGGEMPYSPAASGNGLARFNADGSFDDTFTPVSVVGSLGTVRAIAIQPDGKILVGGYLDNNSSVRIRRLLPTGGLDPSFGTGGNLSIGGGVVTMVVQADGRIFVGGSGLTFSGTPANYLRIDSAGGYDTTFAASSSNTASSAVLLPDGAFLVGGNFSRTGGPVGLAKLTANGAQDPAFALTPRRVGTIHSLSDLPGGAVLVAGQFSYLGGVPAANVARLDADGSVSRTFNGGLGTDGVVYTAVPQSDGRTLLFGSFTKYAGVARAGLARIHPDGSLDSGYNGNLGDPYNVLPARSPGRAVRWSRDRVLFALWSSVLAGSPVNGLAVFNPDGSRDFSFDVGSGVSAGTVNTFAVQPDERVLVGGDFTTFNGQTVGRLVRLLPTGAIDSAFTVGAGPDAAIKAVGLQPDGKVLVAGDFTTISGVARKYVARLLPGGAVDPSFVPANLEGFADGLLLQGDGRILITGEFTQAGAQPNTRYLARLKADGAIDETFQAYGLGARITSPLLRGDGRLYAASASEGLVRFQPAAAPSFTTSPQTIAAVPGANVQFSVVAAGTAPLSYQWRFNGVPIPGAVSPALALENVQLASSGAYTVTVSNVFGSTTSTPVLLKGPNPLPAITAQPATQSATAGQDLIFSVTATVAGTASYQWRRDGLAIPGATSATLNLGPASLRYNGVRYDVLVSDGLSLTLSQPASATVVPSSYPQVVSPDRAYAPTFERTGGQIRAFHRLSDGRIYVAGVFSRLGGGRAWNLARLTADGAWDATFTAATTDGLIETIDVQPDGRVLIGGAFSLVDGVERSGLARLHADGTLDTSFAPTDDLRLIYRVRSLPGGGVFAGGSFSAGAGLVRLLPDGARDPRFNNSTLAGAVNDFAVQADGRLIAGGSFSGPGGVAFNYLARLHADGTLDPTFNTGTGPNFFVKAVRLLDDGRVIIGGYFGGYNSASAGGIVRLTANGAVDPSWSAGSGFASFSATTGVERIELQPDGKLLVLGGYSSFNGTTRRQLTRLLADGALDPSLPAPGGGGVAAVTYLNNGDILLGGSITGNLKVVTSTGAEVSSALAGSLFSPADTQVFALPGGKVFARGSFTHVNGVARSGVARVNSDGALDPSFDSAGTGPSGSVSSVVLQSDGRIVLGGSIGTYDGTTVGPTVRLLPNGARDATFQPDFTGLSPGYSFRLLPLRHGRMLAFLDNTSLQSTFLRLNADGSRDAVFRAPEGLFSSPSVLSVIEQPDGKMILAGTFYATAGGGFLNRVVRLLPDGRIDDGFAVNADGNINAVALLPSGKIIIGGAFLGVNGTPAARVARLNADGSVDAGFRAGFGPNRAVDRLLLQGDGKVLVSGRFTAVDGAPHTAFVARLLADGALDPTFASRGINGSPLTLELNDDGSLLLSGGYALNYSYQQYGVLRLASVPGPAFLTSPQPVAALAGTPVTLAASAAGGVLSYQWLKDGGAVPGATRAELVLPAAQPGDSGSYALRATAGSTVVTSSSAAVAVAPSAPVFADSPAAIAGFGGALALGSRWPLVAPALAAGSAPLAYQWFKDGGAVPGATTRRFLPVWLPSDAGLYHVQISNGAGTVTSPTFAQRVTGTADARWHHPQPQGNALAAAVFLNGRFLAGGARGTILVSPSGQDWSVVRLGVSEAVIAFAWRDGAYVALTSFGGIWSSDDAAGWQRRDSGVGADGRALRAIIAGAGRFVAVGDAGLLVTSFDGATWARGNAGTDDSLQSIAFGGGRFVAVGAGGRTFISNDGEIWQSGAKLPQAVSTIAHGAGRFVIAGGGGAAFSSTDGLAWTESAIHSDQNVRTLQYAHDRFLALLAGDSGENLYAVSDQGTQWTAKGFGGMNYLDLTNPSALTFNGSRYVVVSGGSNPMFSSTDGATWSRSAVAAAPTAGFSAIAAGADQLIAGGPNGYYGALWSSSDGATWSVADSNVPYPIYDVVRGGDRFVAVGSRGLIKTKAGSETWTAPASGTTENLLGVSYVNGRFLATGANGVLRASTDGTTWTTVTTGVTTALYRVAHGNGVYVAVGAAGTVLTSSDATQWTLRPVSGLTATVRAVAFGAGRFVLVSEGGGIHVSANGETWAAQANPLGAGLTALTFAGGRFYAFIAGDTNYLTSGDGRTWGVAQHGSGRAVAAAAPLGGRLFLAGGGLSVLSLPLEATPPAAPSAPADVALQGGGGTTLQMSGAVGRLQWLKDGYAIAGATSSALVLANARAGDSGRYVLLVSNEAGTAASAAVTVRVEVATRGLIAGLARAGLDRPLRGAFTVEGLAPKRLLVRAVGPTLATFGVAGFAPDPALRILNAATGTEYATGDDWGAADNAAQIAAVTTELGAYPLLGGSKDAAVLASFPPGTYRVEVTRAAAPGVASLEIYDTGADPRLVYVATQAEVPAAGSFTQGVTLLAPPAGRSYLIRALGPSTGLQSALGDPEVRVFSGATELAANDNWGGAAELVALAQSVGAMPLPAAGKDAALAFAPAAAGVYSVQVSGVGGAGGTALLEIFEADAQRAATVPLALVSLPEDLSGTAGQSASFGVVAVGKPAPTFQWSRNGHPIPGAAGSTLVIPSAQVGDAGTYTLRVSNGGPVSPTATATLAITPASNATHAVVGRGYVAGGVVTITTTLHYVGAPASANWSVVLPADWSFAEDTSTAGSRPAAGATGTLAWSWANPAASPLTYTTTLNVPAAETATRPLVATALVGGVAVPVAPSPLMVAPRPPLHSADTDDDFALSLFELTRVIELYNTRQGTVRTGAYRVDAAGEDGFGADPTRSVPPVTALVEYHSADTRGAGPGAGRDGMIDLFELTRVIELYNTRSGTVRTGRYRVQGGTEDGFAPGP